MKLVIDSLYVAPIAVWSQIVQAESISLEGYSFYEKGSYRNRCHVYGANGLLRLSVPIRHGKEQRTPMRDVEISYDHPWQDLHWQSLCAAYRRSPFFEYYEDDMKDIYEKEVRLLFDFNRLLLERIAGLLNIDLNLTATASYEMPLNAGIVDGRNASSPKKNKGRWDTDLAFETYEQIFQPKCGFLANLSILDLLFHKGPEAVTYLRAIRNKK